MTKATEPDILFMGQGVTPDWMRQSLAESGWKFVTEPKVGPNVIYHDGRTMPRFCQWTRRQRDFCCCAQCRARRRRKDGAACRCWLCYADRQGSFIDRLGKRTAPGTWALFVTQTYRTHSFPWAKGFPTVQPQPNRDFVRHFLGRAIRWLEDELHEHVEYFVADQYGERNGRLHQHLGITSNALVLAARELSAVRRAAPNTTRLPETLKPFALMLFEKAGFNLIHPWEKDAGYYIGRYIGRDAGRCDWNFRVGSEPVRLQRSVGRTVVAVSPAPTDSSRAYRNILEGWHR